MPTNNKPPLPPWHHRVDLTRLQDFLLGPEGELLKDFLTSRSSHHQDRCNKLDPETQRTALARSQGAREELESLNNPSVLVGTLRDYWKNLDHGK